MHAPFSATTTIATDVPRYCSGTMMCRMWPAWQAKKISLAAETPGRSTRSTPVSAKDFPAFGTVVNVWPGATIMLAAQTFRNRSSGELLLLARQLKDKNYTDLAQRCHNFADDTSSNVSIAHLGVGGLGIIKNCGIMLVAAPDAIEVLQLRLKSTTLSELQGSPARERSSAASGAGATAHQQHLHNQNSCMDWPIRAACPGVSSAVTHPSATLPQNRVNKFFRELGEQNRLRIESWMTVVASVPLQVLLLREDKPLHDKIMAWHAKLVAGGERSGAATYDHHKMITAALDVQTNVAAILSMFKAAREVGQSWEQQLEVSGSLALTAVGSVDDEIDICDARASQVLQHIVMKDGQFIVVAGKDTSVDAVAFGLDAGAVQLGFETAENSNGWVFIDDEVVFKIALAGVDSSSQFGTAHEGDATAAGSSLLGDALVGDEFVSDFWG